MLKRDTNGASKIRSKLKAFDMDLTNAQAAVYLDGETLPGDRETLTCNTECIVIIGAPGEPMKVNEQNPRTDLIVWVTRSHSNQHIANVLPDPLATTRQDFTVKAATAVSYEVKAGEIHSDSRYRRAAVF